jgi:TonB-dependent Receptor Plug Domain/Carboxypeptidase regulatory-like domain
MPQPPVSTTLLSTISSRWSRNTVQFVAAAFRSTTLCGRLRSGRRRCARCRTDASTSVSSAAASTLGFIALTLQTVHAADTNGIVAGSVTDSASKFLQGARIEVEPTGKIGTSDAQGSFAIKDVGAGTYTLTISYLGFEPFKTAVIVTLGETAKVNAVLTVGSKKEEINLTADPQSGEAEAVNRERTADNVLQVLPAEVIVSLPNANVADAIGRLPSVTLERDEGEGKYVQIRGTQPRFSNVTIDGVNVPSPEGGARQVKLDVIPSDLVESVEINKTLLANMDGDAIGGVGKPGNQNCR